MARTIKDIENINKEINVVTATILITKDRHIVVNNGFVNKYVIVLCSTSFSILLKL